MFFSSNFGVDPCDIVVIVDIVGKERREYVEYVGVHVFLLNENAFNKFTKIGLQRSVQNLKGIFHWIIFASHTEDGKMRGLLEMVLIILEAVI